MVKRRVFWFLGEFFVVVSGVLVAFLLNGWWLNIKDAEKERVYLKQIHDDLKSTRESVALVTKQQKSIVHAGSQLLAAAHMQNPPEPSELDNLLMNSLSFAPAYHVSAALSSMVNTGELALIRNDSLRIILGELVSRLAEYTSTNNEMGFSWVTPAIDKIVYSANLADFRFQFLDEKDLHSIALDSLGAIPPLDNLKLPEPIDMHALLNTPDFKGDLMILHIAQNNLYRSHKGFLLKLDEAKDMLEAEMKNRDIPLE